MLKNFVETVPLKLSEKGLKKSLQRRDWSSFERPHKEADIHHTVLRGRKNLGLSEDTCVEKETRAIKD